MLPNSAVVRAVLIEDGLRDALADGRIVIDMSSSEPLRTRELAADLADARHPAGGCAGLRRRPGAQNGTLTIMVGGPMPIVDRVSIRCSTLLGKPCMSARPGRATRSRRSTT